MRTSIAEVNPSQGSCSSSGQCYQTVAQCNVSTISSNLDGNQTLKVWAPSVCVCIDHLDSVAAAPTCTLPFTVKHPEKQKRLRMESLLQPQWYRSVVLSVAMKYHTRAECCSALHRQGQRRTCHERRHHTDSSLDASSLLGMKMKQGFLVKANPLLWFW